MGGLMGHRILFVVLLAMALAGCQGGGSGPSTSAFKEVWIGDVGEYGESYELVKDITINGQLVKKGTLLRGKLMSGTKFAEGKWLIPPEYTELVGRDQLIYGLRVGDKTFVRIDISTGRMKTEPTAFTSVHLLQFTPEMGYSEWDRWVGMTEGSQNVTLLDNKTGRSERLRLDRLRPCHAGWNRSGSIEKSREGRQSATTRGAGSRKDSPAPIGLGLFLERPAGWKLFRAGVKHGARSESFDRRRSRITTSARPAEHGCLDARRPKLGRPALSGKFICPDAECCGKVPALGSR
jgi:hypothetical protein